MEALACGRMAHSGRLFGLGSGFSTHGASTTGRMVGSVQLFRCSPNLPTLHTVAVPRMARDANGPACHFQNLLLAALLIFVFERQRMLVGESIRMLLK